MTPRILITGATGMLGAYLVRWFNARGYTSIKATYTSDISRIPPDILDKAEWVPLYLPDQQTCYDVVAGCDWVVHSAGMVSYNPKHKYRLLDINKTGTGQLVNAALEHGVSHFIYIGSISALGKEEDHITLDEHASWHDTRYSTSYGLSKFLGEAEAWRGAAEGMPVSVILPSVILGTGDWTRSSLQLIDRVVHKPGWYPGGQTGFVDVRDVCQFVQLLLEQSRTGDRWILSARDMKHGEVYATIARKLELKKSFRGAPKWLAKLTLYGNNFRDGSTLGTEIIETAYATFSYNASKSMTLEGFRYRDPQKSIEDICLLYQKGLKDGVLEV